MTESPLAKLPPRVVRVREAGGGVDLYYPPLRSAEAAVPLALFGLIAFALPAAGAAALLPSALATPGGTLTAVLVGAFVAPFALFGLALVAQAIYMLAHALEVHVDRGGIRTRQSILGLQLRARGLARADIAAIEPVIVSRHQGVFTREPRYQLVARDAAQRRRVVVGDGLKGAPLMERVRRLIETALGETLGPAQPIGGPKS